MLLKNTSKKIYNVTTLVFIVSVIRENCLLAVPSSYDSVKNESGEYYLNNKYKGIWGMSSSNVDFSRDQAEDIVFVEVRFEDDIFVTYNQNVFKIIEVNNEDTSNEANIALVSERVDAFNQQWTFDYLDNTFYKISPINSPNKALEIKVSSLSSCGNVQIGINTVAVYLQCDIAQTGSNYYRMVILDSFLIIEIINAFINDRFVAQKLPFSGHDCHQGYLQNPLQKGNNDGKTSVDVINVDGITVYPKPSKGSFNIKVTQGNATLQQASVLTINGKKVFKDNLQDEYNFVLNTGIYCSGIIYGEAFY